VEFRRENCRLLFVVDNTLRCCCWCGEVLSVRGGGVVGGGEEDSIFGFSFSSIEEDDDDEDEEEEDFDVCRADRLIFEKNII
jgi:hypothetical protein